MWDKVRFLAAPLVALSLLSASASGQVTPEVVQAAGAPAPATQAAPQLTATDVNAWLDGFMPTILANSDVAGTVVTVVKDGQVIASRGYGYADLEERMPVDPDRTLVRPGSISKLFTWVAVMQQVEQGHLDPDADVNAYLDFEIPAYEGEPVTLRNILTHTTGFEEVLSNLILKDPAPEITLETYVRNHVPTRIFPPGRTPAYSNYATALAGYIVQRVSGEDFAAYIRTHIFDPLGMRNSTFEQPLPEAMQAAMSRGYRSRRDGEAQAFEIVPAAPAGALSSTASDLALFMNAMLNDGAGVLQPATTRQMFETIDQQFPGVNSMALGFYQEDYNNHRILAHGGDTGWFHSNLALWPDDNIGIFISVNSAGAESIGAQLWRWTVVEGIIDRYYPTPPTTLPEPEPTAREHGAAVVGVYESARRPETSPLVIMPFLGQDTVTMLPNGDLVGLGLPDGNGARKHWREVEPWVWQAVGGHQRLGARVEEDGSVNAVAAEPLSFAITYTRAPWWRSKAWLLPALGAAITVLLLTFLSWPIRALARRSMGKAFPYEGPRALAHRIGGAASLLILTYLGVWIGFLVRLITTLTESSDGSAAGVFVALYVAGIIPVLAFLGLGYMNFNLWRAPSSWVAKAWGALVLVSAFVILWFAFAMNFFSFVTRY